MKTKIIFTVLFLLVATTLISFNFFQTSTLGPHDGIVKQTGEYNIEMKNSFPNFYAYLLNKKLTPISNSGISCEVRFMSPDSTSFSVPLKPFGKDGFLMDSGTLKFNSCRIYFTVSGRSISAEFENENLFVEKK